MRDLYPSLKPYNEGFLQVSSLHTIYFEESGNPNGEVVIFLHGGPGVGSESTYRQYFDPQKWRIVAFDQRGCGKSTPHAEILNNTTWDLVSDIEKLRAHLKVEKWVVFGGSWGSTLALVYSQTHPNRCKGLILRGIFLIRQKELHWLYQEGANYIFPDAWKEFVELIPENERDDMILAYYKRLTSKDMRTQIEAASRWAVWEASTSKLRQDEELIRKFAESHFAHALARIECHYFIERGFFDDEEQLLNNVGRIRHIPAVFVQGRYDIVCPMVSAWELHSLWPEAELIVVPDAGHGMTESGIRSALIEATDRFHSK